MAKKYELGIVTIGQSPRPDMTGDLAELWGEAISLVEEGALDGLSAQEIAGLGPEGQRMEEVLVTKLRDGTVVQVTEENIRPQVQRAINRLEQRGIHHILLLCTGDFGTLKCGGVLWQSSQLLKDAVASLNRSMPAGTLALVIPDEGQRREMEQRWKKEGVNAEIHVLSPYSPNYDRLEVSPEVSQIVLDCMGYSREVEERVGSLLGRPVYRARRLIGEEIIKKTKG